MTENKLNIYIDGVFDLTHYGHFELVQKVKEKFPNSNIIVGICSDEDCQKYKRKPIMNIFERSRTMELCKNVNKIVPNCPWIIDKEFIDKENIDFVCHDSTPYKSNDCDDVYSYVKSIGKFQHIDRSKGISTTDIIKRVKDY